jgi:colanic acid/amylovoran biosynthesis glycosyltransferase
VLATNQFPKYSETFIVRQLLGLIGLGWDMHVVCPSSDRTQLAYFPELDHPDLLARIHVTKDVDGAVAHLRPDIVHFEFGTVGAKNMSISARYGCRTVVSFRGYDMNYHKLDEPTYYDDVWASADMLHFVGNDIGRRSLRRGCPPGTPSIVIPDAADVDFFVPPHREVERAADRPFRILSVGRLHWKKGYEFALEAVARLRDSGIPVQYRIVGDGDLKEAVAFGIHDLGLEDVTTMVGAATREQVREELWQADVMLHAAVSEGFCVSALEAQACGVPVVTSDADGLGENVADGVSGFVVRRRDAAALADGLRTIAVDESLRARLGVAARHRAVTEFSLATQTEAFDALYRELLRRPVRAGGVGVTVADVEDRALRLQVGVDRLRSRRLQDSSVKGARALVRSLVPTGASVMVVSLGDRRLGGIADVVGRFPEDGGVAGGSVNPVDDADAIARLEARCESGAEYLVVPSTSMWWLDHYRKLRSHLEDEHRALCVDPEVGAVFALTPAHLRRAATPASRRDDVRT